MAAYDYPDALLERRHGPQGYASYQSYRPWLRDDFTFQCVYCLLREQWGRATGDFDLDHFLAQERAPEVALEYDNLFYACHSCNLLKGPHEIPDPGAVLTSEQVRVNPDGSLDGLNDEARKIIRLLALDSNSCRQRRRMWMRIIELAQEHDRELYLQLMGFPNDLPDLSRLRPPAGNSRPEGISQSWFAKKSRDELPEEF